MTAGGLYEDLDKDDLPDPEAIPVEADLPAVEGPREIAALPPVKPGEDEEAWPPPVPTEAPGNVGAPAPLPGTPAAAAQGHQTPQELPDPAAELLRQQGDLERQKAEGAAKLAERQTAIAQGQDEDARLAHADYLEQRAAAQKRYEEAVAKYEAGGKLTDPRDKDSGSVRAQLYRAFSGLGIGANNRGHERSQQAIAEQQKKWDDDTDRQKFAIAQLKDNVVRARTGLDDVDAGRRAMQREADAFNEARYGLAERQGRAQLAHLGVPKAEIETNSLIQQLQAGRAAAKLKAQAADDAHALAQARVRYFDARAGRKKGSAGGGSGALAELSDLADNGAPLGDLIRANKGRAKFQDVQKVYDEAQRKKAVETKATRPGGGGGAGGQKATKEVADLDAGVRNLDTLIAQIEKNPAAWEEYRNNAEGWARKKGLRENMLGSVLQGANLMDIRQEQGLKTDDAKTLFQRQERLNTDIAKSFGGVITEGDREAAASNQANFALDAKGKVAQLKEMRAQLAERRKSWGGAQPSGPAAKKEVTPDEKYEAAKRVVNDPNVSQRARENAGAYVKSYTKGGK